eukprot:TRINITY_DN2439_c0_g1_i1.p1 TRINITY_DN2439_c0_g1~~TRINITY_DN2439_c0_g1_i1.p1  ORF type:complete len:673 (-),score=164.09 TRINITY_DN2439_c0_g1_i1:941-2959(-)
MDDEAEEQEEAAAEEEEVSTSDSAAEQVPQEEEEVDDDEDDAFSTGGAESPSLPQQQPPSTTNSPPTSAFDSAATPSPTPGRDAQRHAAAGSPSPSPALASAPAAPRWDDAAADYGACVGFAATSRAEARRSATAEAGTDANIVRTDQREEMAQTDWGNVSARTELATQTVQQGTLPVLAATAPPPGELCPYGWCGYLLQPGEHEKLKQLLSENRVAGLLEELDRNLASHAFDMYHVEWEDTVESIQMTAELSYAIPATGEGEYNCSGLSWNSTGSVLAAGYGALDHSGWCSHKGFVCFWSVFKESAVAQSKPEATAETGSCVMCVAFHPTLPTVLAVGTFNGQVLLIDSAAKDDPIIASSDLNDDSGHREPVSSVAWLSGQGKASVSAEVASSSGDGKLLVWVWGGPAAPSHLALSRSLLTRPPGGGRKDLGALGLAGVAAAAFFEGDRLQAVIGTEGGSLFKCNIPAERPRQQQQQTQAQMPSLQYAYESHQSPVLHVAASPFHHNVFASAAADSVRVYNASQARALLTLAPPSDCFPFCIAWSTSRPTVLASGCSDGRVYMYDFSDAKEQLSPVALQVSRAGTVRALSFNARQPGCMATGDSAAVVKVWQLSRPLTVSTPTERIVLKRFGDISKKGNTLAKSKTERGTERAGNVAVVPRHIDSARSTKN